MQQVVQECSDLATAERIWWQLTREHPPEDWWQIAPAFSAWAKYSPSARPLPLLAAHVGSEVVALLSVRSGFRSIFGAKLHLLEMAGDEHWKPASPIIGRDPERSLAALLDGLRHHRGWDMLELGPMLEETSTLRLLMDQARRAGLRPHICARVEDPVVKLTGSWEQYYSSLSGNLRSQVKRGEAKLLRHGTLTLEEYCGGPDLDARLDEFFRIESSGWKGRAGTAILNDPLARQFYTRLAHETAPCGWLRLYLLRVGDRCIAADYCLACQGTVYMLKVGYDEDWSYCSPGQVMRKRVLQHLFSSGRDEIYDMLSGGGEHRAYKIRWANHLRPCVIVRLFNPGSLRGQIAAGASRLRGWLRQRRAGKQPKASSPAVAEVIANTLATLCATGLAAAAL
ncbi:MAG: GNAT family N-acetyltransferase [Bacillota bacterium]